MLASVALAALAACAAQALPAPVPAPAPLNKLQLHKRFIEQQFPYVDTSYPYTGPKVPVGDWLDQTVDGNGKGYQRLYKNPAVLPPLGVSVLNITNNINVISTSYAPSGINIHFQTPFGIGEDPVVRWGYKPDELSCNATGKTSTYDRTPPCSMLLATQCSQYFHHVTISDLNPNSTIYYQIPGGNGTHPSSTLSVRTAPAVGAKGSFETVLVNDMGYTNAHGTHEYMRRAAQEGASFVWHGGDISYADNWFEGILPCDPSWDVCVDGIHTELPGPAPVPAEYLSPLPAGEPAEQGGPLGGDISQVYEKNWDLWQQWTNEISTLIPYQVTPGNHEAACAEFDGPNNQLTGLLVFNETGYNATSPTSNLSYYACPPSQRNFTAYNHRFFMDGEASDGRGNMWGSFDYGMAHFVSISTETDFYQSPEAPFIADTKGNGTTPTEEQTWLTDAGPFGYINGSYTDNSAYEQVQWLRNDLAQVDRNATPFIFVMGHRPMYSSQVASYQKHVRNAFEEIMIQGGVDAYFSGHIHFYERMFPMTAEGQVEHSAVQDNHTYIATNSSMIHIIEGNAGNVESHSTIDKSKILNITAELNEVDYGFAKLRVHNSTHATYSFIRGEDGSTGDYVNIIKASAQ